MHFNSASARLILIDFMMGICGVFLQLSNVCVGRVLLGHNAVSYVMPPIFPIFGRFLNASCQRGKRPWRDVGLLLFYNTVSLFFFPFKIFQKSLLLWVGIKASHVLPSVAAGCS